MNMNKIITLSLITTLYVSAGGYKIPEQSQNALALSNAYLAHTMGADTAYYNPAAMVFMGDKQYLEAGLMVVHISSQVYTNGKYSGESESETIPIPSVYYVSAPMGDVRWGLSLNAPSGATRRWETPYQKLSSEKFQLENVQLNPVVAYKVNPYFSIGGGFRIMYSQGGVYSDGGDIKVAKREMTGSGTGFGYNFSMLLNPYEGMNLAMSYTSQIDLKEEGKVNLYVGKVGKQFDATLDLIHPAELGIGLSQTWNDNLTVEVKYERTFWSAYKELDFEYDGAIPEKLQPKFEDPQVRGWKDTNAFRIGTTYRMDRLTLMAGFALDESPISQKYLGFELADSDAKLYSLGFKYKQTSQLSWGASFMYVDKEDFTLAQGVSEDELVLTHGGDFSEGDAYLLSLGLSYEF